MGKLGIILAFLISTAAAGGSYFLYQSWVEERTVRSNIEEKFDLAKEEMLAVQSEKDQIKAEKEKVVAESQGYRTQAEAMQSTLENLKTQKSRTDSEKAALEKELKTNQEMIAELQAKMVDLEKKAKEAQAACGVTPADLKTGPFATGESSAAMSAPVAGAETTVGSGAESSQLVFKPVAPGEAAAMPVSEVPVVQEVSPATATTVPSNPVTEAKTLTQLTEAAATTGPKVLTVNRKFNFVVINQGLQEGLKMGDKLKVYKQGKESATVQIEKLYDKFSAATLIAEDPKQKVVEGDEIRKA